MKVQSSCVKETNTHKHLQTESKKTSTNLSRGETSWLKEITFLMHMMNAAWLHAFISELNDATTDCLFEYINVKWFKQAFLMRSHTSKTWLGHFMAWKEEHNESESWHQIYSRSYRSDPEVCFIKKNRLSAVKDDDNAFSFQILWIYIGLINIFACIFFVFACHFSTFSCFSWWVDGNFWSMLHMFVVHRLCSSQCRASG